MDNIYEEGRQRFAADPSKCFQRHLREIRGELEQRTKIESLKGCMVVAVSVEEAKTIILKYEWLKTMGAETRYCYGLKSADGELLGVACFNNGRGNARDICGPETVLKTVSLVRGACVPHAPKDAGSFLVRHACRLVHRDHGHEIFFAYSDPAAGEIGTIYQAVGWKNIGTSVGRGLKTHRVYFRPDGTRMATHKQYAKYAIEHGWTEDLKDEVTGKRITKRRYLKEFCELTYAEEADRNRWVWFEGKNKVALMKACCVRFPFLAYPKRKG